MILLEFVPTYEYECPRCPRVFEVRQRISEPPLGACDRCGGPVRRLLSAAPFILKGDGWHATDYPSESRKKALKGESTASSGSGPDSSSKDSAPKESKSPASTSGDSKSSTSSAAAPASGSASGATKAS